VPESGGTGPREAEILLYQTSPQNITQLIAAIYAEGELEEAATCKSNLQVRREGSRDVRRQLKHYSLPVVLAKKPNLRGGTSSDA
jgi:hypothetical protein